MMRVPYWDMNKGGRAMPGRIQVQSQMRHLFGRGPSHRPEKAEAKAAGGEVAARALLERGPSAPAKSSPMMRCPSCGEHFHEGGEVAKNYDRVHEGTMRYADRTRKYDKSFDHYYAEGEAGFAHGGRVDGAGKVDGIHTDPKVCRHLAAGGVCRHYASGGAVEEDLTKHKRTDDAENKAEYQRMLTALEPTTPKRFRQQTTPRSQSQGYASGGEVEDSFSSYLAKRRDARRSFRAG